MYALNIVSEYHAFVDDVNDVLQKIGVNRIYNSFEGFQLTHWNKQ